MNHNQPLFFLCNTARKEEFLIETRIWKRSNGLVAEKRPCNEHAAHHLISMAKTQTTLSNIKPLTKQINIAAASLRKDGAVEFEYIEGESVDRKLLNVILIEDYESAYKIIDKLFAIIESLPVVRVNPKDDSAYISIFNESFSSTQACTKFGIIDLNLDNFIISRDGTWNLYDYEWVFDFPVPKQMLRIRSLFYFFARYHEVLSYHAQHIKCISIGGEILIPSALYLRYEKEFKYLEDLYIAEQGFQRYVTGSDSKRASVLLKSFEVSDMIQKPKDMNTFFEKAQATEEKLDKKTHELNALMKTKSYRFARKIVRIRRKITSWANK